MQNRLKIPSWPLAAMITVLACCLAGPTLVQAEPTIIWMGPNYPSDINADGSVVVGNTGDGLYETFRWTEEFGLVRLGQSSVAIFGSGAGTPDVSDDGNHVSATVANADSTFVCGGIWTKGEGWAYSMPPIPEDGGISEVSAGSCWGLSGDGSTLTGFYWRPGATDGTAHVHTWSEAEGHQALGSPIRNSRGNAASYDGSVVVGWSESDFGNWLPTVWENGGYTVLLDDDQWSEAEGVSNDGNTIWGKSYNPESNQMEATIWMRSDQGWDQFHLGVLPGTFPGYGQAICQDMTEDLSTAVGYNEFNWGTGTGFVWTLEQGMISADDFMAAEGFDIPQSYTVGTLTGISHNGVAITGFCWDTSTFPYTPVGFVAYRENVSPVADQLAAPLFQVEGNHPNPFNPSTTISLSVDQSQTFSLEVFDLAGRKVQELHRGLLNAGRHNFTWNGRNQHGQLVSSGVYFARLRDSQGRSQAHRMMLVK